MNLHEEIPDEIVAIAECYQIFADMRFVPKFNPFAEITEEGIGFNDTRRVAEYSEGLDKCMKIVKELISSKSTNNVGPNVQNITQVIPNQLPPIDYIKARFRVSSEELYKVYNLNTRSERTILSNTLCKHNTGIIKKISHGKLYFIYQPESTNKEG